MMWEVRAGTPNTLDKKRLTTATPVKGFMQTRIANVEQWAGAHNLQVKREIETIRREIDGLALQTLPVGQTRRWSTTDDYSGVEFVFEIERID